MSFKLPIGVETICNPVIFLFINLLFIFIVSCTPVNFSTISSQPVDEETKNDNNVEQKINYNIVNQKIEEQKNLIELQKETNIQKEITVLIFNKDKKEYSRQFINILELGIFNKNLKEVVFDIQTFENKTDLEKIISETNNDGKIYIGPINTEHTKVVKNYCNKNNIFFSFSSDTSLADNCVYLLNFFPKNELEQLLFSLENNAKIALLFSENNYGYMINGLIDDIINNSEAILVNRSSYSNDLSNVRNAIKELGKYELRKYELYRQKQILISKSDEQSKNRLKKLQKFKTTSDYDFTHIIIADYGLNLLKVAPLLPFYDIDPEIVQFLGTGVMDDENFFYEPSLQGAIFPGIELDKRIDLLKQYEEIYSENLLRVSTLPYDLVGLLNYIFLRNLNFFQFVELLNNSNIKFDGVDGEFYFKDNMIERKLDILKISNGSAKKIN